MLALGAALSLYLSQADTVAIEDELRRARNEYAYGNYDAAVSQLRALLYPMRLSTDEQVIEARKYLALCYYLQSNKSGVREEFTKLLYLDPDHELDPFTIAPSIIDLFERLRSELKPDLDVIRQRRTDVKLDAPPVVGYRRVVEYRVTEHSDIAVFLPFGVGQFQNGQPGWGVAFATVELGLLAANVGAYVAALNTSDAEDKRTYTILQYSAAALFGVAWTLGVFHARLNFVPSFEAPPAIRDEPIESAALSGGALQLRVTF